MESRSVYLGIATRMRGSCTGALSRTYLHSEITEALWYAVVESEQLLAVRLSHAVMLASLYGNPQATLEKGNDQIHEMYMGALGLMPYVGASVRRKKASADDGLVEEWRRVNSELAAEKAGPEGEEAEDA